jgi:hypothetical protein
MSIHATEVATQIIEVDPDKPESEVKVDLGGTLEFKLKSHDFDHFEITFEESWPPNAGKHFKGTIDHPILVHMPHETKSFHYRLVFKKKDGTSKYLDGPFLAHSCPACG